MKRPLFFASLLTAIVLLTTGCHTPVPSTQQFVSSGVVGASAPLPDGGLRYGEKNTGKIWDADKKGNRSAAPIAEVSVTANNGNGGLLGLVIDSQNRTFASWTDSQSHLVVAQVAPGTTRIIWNGPAVSGSHIGGTLAMTPQNRVLIGVGDLGDHNKATDDSVFNGKLLTLDPDRDASQQPNAISKGWTNPLGLAYMDGLLWIADSGTNAPDRLGRVGDVGFNGQSTVLGTNTNPTGLSVYGDQEVVVCMAGTQTLKRFLINDEEAVPGRVLATGCTGSVAQLSDERIVYAAGNNLRITAS